MTDCSGVLNRDNSAASWPACSGPVGTRSRRRRLRMFATAGVLLWLLTQTAFAQGPRLISLGEAVDLALAHNHSIKATRTLILQNQAQEITANLRPNPTLGLD